MVCIKKIAAFALFAGFVVCSGAIAQEMSIEDSYLQQSVEVMIVKEQAANNDRESKLLALEYVRQMLENGDGSEPVRAILQDMALEGTLNKVREEGRTANNFPDIRMKAVAYLGGIKTKESANALVKVLLIDPEPSVVAEAIHSLENIGINDNDEIVHAISFVFIRYDARNPNNVLALSVINALNTFCQKTGSRNPEIYKILNTISVSPSYTANVRNFALKKLSELSKLSVK
ncbi:MAG: HEAT repeat domain-containing protein [Termitinemataceae bacterium]|nr:MAG: HEAT repeat domain-containing protein [Termitinemataceae bacterium]